MINLPQFKSKLNIRELTIGKANIGGDSSLSFMSENNNKTNPVFAVEIPYFVDKNYPELLKAHWGNKIADFESLFEAAQNTECDMVCVQINVDEADFESKTGEIISSLEKVIAHASKPVIVKGSGNKNIDKILIPKIAKNIKTQIIIASAEEATYEKIIPGVVKNNHYLVLHSPIDINLAKELNILSIDGGLSAERIIIDPDLGALGYGLDYGYSIIEKIRHAAFDGDSMLNMPIITFIGEETFKIKEAKTDSMSENWGEHKKRAIMWEAATASSIISAGSNKVVLYHPDSIKTLKEILWN